MSLVVDIAEAVKNELSMHVAEFAETFTSEVKLLPKFDIKDLVDLCVIVVPKSKVIEPETRTETNNEIQIDIGVLKKLEGTQNEIDEQVIELLSFTESISDFLNQRVLDGEENARWMKTENDPLYGKEELHNSRVYISVLTLTYEIIN